MIENFENKRRINFEEGYKLYPKQYVLLGHVEHNDNGDIENGIPFAIGNEEDHDDIWDLFYKIMEDEQYGSLFLFYYGPIETAGILL